MVSFNYRLIYDIGPITATGSLGYLSGSSSVIRKKMPRDFIRLHAYITLPVLISATLSEKIEVASIFSTTLS